VPKHLVGEAHPVMTLALAGAEILTHLSPRSAGRVLYVAVRPVGLCHELSA